MTLLVKCPAVHSLTGVMQISRPKKHVYLLSSECPFFFAADPKGFFIILLGIPGEFPVWPYSVLSPYIKKNNKIMKGKKERERMYKKSCRT